MIHTAELPSRNSQLRAIYRYWLETRANSSISASTLRIYMIAWRLHVEPILGKRLVRELKRGDIKSYYAGAKSSGMADLGLAVLAHLFEVAEDFGIVTESPVKDIKRKARDTRPRPIAPADHARIKEWLQRCPRPAAKICLLYLATGLRKGEAASIVPEWVSADGSTLTIPWTHLKGAKAGMNFVRTLVTQEERDLVSFVAALPRPAPWLSRSNRIWYRMRDELGLDTTPRSGVTPHKARHTFVSTLLNVAGMSTAHVSALVNHRDPNALRHYYKPDSVAAAEALRAFMAKTANDNG